MFLAADRTRLGELDQAVRQYLAWKSIEDERETLNLDAFQANQAKTKREQADETIRQRIPETYQWLLAPGQPDPQAAVEWQEIRLQGQDSLAVRAAKKLRNEELLVTQFAGTRLRLELDRVPLWRGDHVGLKQLAEDFARYLYLPRLKDSEVLLAAVRDGLGLITWQQESFAYADGWDADKSRYRGLRAGQIGGITLEGESVLVKPEVAVTQLNEEQTQAQPTTTPSTSRQPYEPTAPTTGQGAVANGELSVVPRIAAAPKRFFGTVALDPARAERDAGRIAEEIIQHLAGLVGAKVEVTLDIHAEIPDGTPDHIVRTVTENCRTLRFKTHGFEET